MARRNRMAWWLAAILAVPVLVGGMVLAAHYQSRLPEHERWVMLLPKSEWGFGPDEIAAIRSALHGYLQRGAAAPWPQRWRLGIVTVRVEWSTPARTPAPTGPRLIPSSRGTW